MFIQTETTRDPSSLKFLPGRQVLAEGTMLFRDRAAAARSPLASRLFDIDGVASVFLDPASITVTTNDGDWQELKTPVLGAIMEHFMSGAPVVAGPAGTSGDGEDAAARVRDALRVVIDPELGYNIVDIGLIYDVTVEGHEASIIMTTTTRGCPATDYLRQGARDAASSVKGIDSVEVELSYDPPWQPAMMSAEAKEHFGIME